MFALLVVGGAKVNAEVRTDWDPSDAFSTTWTAATNTLSWNKNWANVLYTGFAPKSNSNSTPVDLSKYDKIHYNITSLSGTASDANGAYIELKVRSTGKDDINLKLYEGEHDIVFADYAATIDFSKILELTVSATYEEGAENGTPGSAVIPEMYLYTDKWIIQHQQQTVSAYALGSALELSSVVSNNSLVSIASTDGDIIYGAYDIATGSTGNQIKREVLNTAMGYVNAAESGKATYRYKISVATDDGLVLPAGVTALYCIQACNGSGDLYRGPYWQNGFLCDLGWCTSVNKGDLDNGNPAGDFFAFIPVAGKENTYKISSYKIDGTVKTENYQGKSEWTLNVVGETQQQSNVDVWVELPNLTFDDYGFATTDKVCLTATGGLSYNSVTGALTSDGAGTAGTFTLEFNTPVNLEDLNTFNVKRSGDADVVNRLKFYDSEGSEINTWNNAKWQNYGLDKNATNAFKDHNPVKKLVWQLDAASNTSAKTLTISGIDWQKKTISAMKGVDITTLPYKQWSADGDNDATVQGDATPTKNIGVLTGSVVYGSDNINSSNKYVDLTNYKKLIVRGYGNIRLFYNWVQSSSSKPETSLTNNTTTSQTMELDIPAFMAEKGISHFHLVGVKTNWGAQLFVESISVSDGTEKFDYTISGNGGMLLQSAQDALADATATAFDATGLTVTHEDLKETLTPANPNALFIANEGVLANANNVIVNGTCANLVLVDGNPFKAPADFTAPAASYNTTISTAAQAGTLCLPFDAAIPDDVTAYTLTYTSGDAATATAVETTIPANTPVLLNGSGAAAFAGANVAVDADADNVEGAMTGVFAATQVPDGSYVLQNGDEGVGFYVVEPTEAIIAKPFRAYLTAQAAAGANLRIAYVDEEVTGIAGKEAPAAKRGAIYTVAGQRVAKPTKGFYIQDGKTYYAK